MSGFQGSISYNSAGGSGGIKILAVNNGLSLSPFAEVQLGQPIGAIGSPANLLGNREIPLNGNKLQILPGAVFFPSGNLALGPVAAAVDDALGQLQIREAAGLNAFITARSGTVNNIFGSTVNGGLLGTQSNDDLQFFTQGTQHMNLKAQGYIQFTEAGTPELSNYDLRLRNVAIPGPVPTLRPSGNPGFPNANIALDIMPFGNPGDYLNNGTAWIDVCNADCLASSLTNVQVARVAAFSNMAVFGSASFGAVITPVPVVFIVNQVEVARFDTTGHYGVGVAAPTAKLHLPAGTAAAGTAPLKIDPGVLMAVPESGAVESDGTHLYWTDAGGNRHQIVTL